MIAIIGIVAGIALPNLGAFKPNVTAAATRQLLDDLARARQLAISQRTTVFMVFVPAAFWNDPAYDKTWGFADPSRSTNLFSKQLIGYNLLTKRSIGEQPGRQTPRYLSTWRTLPDGVVIPSQKFSPFDSPPKNFPTRVLDISTNGGLTFFPIYGFHTNNLIPFPSEQAPSAPASSPPKWATLPYIAFNYMGQLVDAQNNPTRTDELIPLAKGSVGFAHDGDKNPVANPPSPSESPLGNSTNAYHVVWIEWLTGRAHLEHQEIR